MIRLTLRQFRAQAVISFGLLAVLAVVLGMTGVGLAQVNDAFEAGCKAIGDCASSANPILTDDQGLQTFLPIIAIFAPMVIGVFFGAPLIASELETGTFRLAWTQSVTRRRWLAVKVALVGLAAVAIAALLTAIVDWWLGPLDAATQNLFDPWNFGFHGVVPIGYAAFAFALGVTAGVLLRRTVPAMAATLLGFVVARIAITSWVRPYLASPLHESVGLLTAHPILSVQGPGNTFALIPPQVSIPNAWVYSTTVVDSSGYTPTGSYLLNACPDLAKLPNVPPGPVIQGCFAKLSATFHTLVTYQPADRFWPFQWAELGIFLVAALALSGLAYWWLRRQYA